MLLTFLPHSIYDEAALSADSIARSSSYRIQNSLVSYGAVSGTDTTDYFQITPGIGTFYVFVTADLVNGFGSSQLASNFDFKLTNASGTVLLDSSVFTDAGDDNTRIIGFQSSSTASYYIEIRNPNAASFVYAATLSTGAPKVDTIPPVAPKLITNAAFNFLVDPQVTVNTSLGSIVVELNPEQAPATVANMLAYANGGYYDGTIFHRVISGFMVQGGGFTSGLVSTTPTYAAIPLESNNGLTNLRGSIAMARTSDPNSATSQFFINQVDNAFLNYTSATTQGYGYAVFGKVVSGMPVVDSIAAVPTQTVGSFADVPVTNVIINSVQQTLAGSSITNAATLTVSALEIDSQWAYSLDGGANWITGAGTSFNVPVGTYAANAIQVRQRDATGNLSATTGKFGSALVVETTAPQVVSFSPADEASGIATNANIVIVFSENVAFGTGNLLLKNADGNIIESFNAATSNLLSLSGTTLTINPNTELARGAGYKLEVPPGAIKDLAGNAYAGTAGYNFTTKANEVPVAATYAGRSARVNEPLAINLGMLFSDADGDILTFGAAGLPAGLSINASTGQISGTTPATTGTHHITVTATDPGNAPASLAFDLVLMATATANVLTRGGSPLPGVAASQFTSAHSAGELFGFRNIVVDTDAGTGVNTLSAELYAAAGSGQGSLGFTLNAIAGAQWQSFELSGTVTAANNWNIVSNTGVGNSYSLNATHASASISAGTLIGKLTLTLPTTTPGASILDLTAATLGGQAAPDRSLVFSRTNLDNLGQLNSTLPDSSLAASLERGITDLVVAGKKPVTAADALDALKLSVNIAASQGNTWKELIAADINKDGRVTAADALEILKISVGINTIQPSWVFVPTDAGVNPNLGTMTRNTVSYKDDLNLASITGPTSTTFIGILVGDVNNSWVIPP